jgi:peptidoglycan/xylan/chitin deacetylase (PgdA/CDA1 family)
MGSLLVKTLIDISLFLCGRNKLSILTYHRVGDSSHAVSMDESLFEQQLIWIKRYFNPVGLDEGLRLQEQGYLPKGSVAITVDDGYADSYNTIFPLLEKHGLKATFFISTIGFEKGYLWDELVAFNIMTTQIPELLFNNNQYSLLTHEQRLTCLIDCLNTIKYHATLKRDLLIEQLINQTKQSKLLQQFLTRDQTLKLHNAGMGIGAHTHTHPILLKENKNVALHEIKQSKTILEGIIKGPVEYFAYPNGKFGLDFDITHIEMVKKSGFLAALSTDKGVVKDQKIDGFQIKRFTPWDETELKFVLRLALNYCQ